MNKAKNPDRISETEQLDQIDQILATDEITIPAGWVEALQNSPLNFTNEGDFHDVHFIFVKVMLAAYQTGAITFAETAMGAAASSTFSGFVMASLDKLSNGKVRTAAELATTPTTQIN